MLYEFRIVHKGRAAKKWTSGFLAIHSITLCTALTEHWIFHQYREQQWPAATRFVMAALDTCQRRVRLPGHDNVTQTSAKRTAEVVMLPRHQHFRWNLGWLVEITKWRTRGTGLWSDVCFALLQRLTRLLNNKQTFDQRFIFARFSSYADLQIQKAVSVYFTSMQILPF